jgi:hypothetical protein
MKSRPFEEWYLGETIFHAQSRTIRESDGLLALSLLGSLGRPRAGRFVPGRYLFALMLSLSAPDIESQEFVTTLHFDNVVLMDALIGDTLRASSQVVEIGEHDPKFEVGIVVFRHEMRNQRSDIVCECLRITRVISRGSMNGLQKECCTSQL